MSGRLPALPACLPTTQDSKVVSVYLNIYLNDRRDVDRVSRGSCSGERRLGLGRVSEGVVHPRLDKVRLHQELLVVHALKLPEELVQQRHGVLVLALLEKLAEIKKIKKQGKRTHVWVTAVTAVVSSKLFMFVRGANNCQTIVSSVAPNAALSFPSRISPSLLSLNLFGLHCPVGRLHSDLVFGARSHLCDPASISLL